MKVIWRRSIWCRVLAILSFVWLLYVLVLLGLPRLEQGVKDVAIGQMMKDIEHLKIENAGLQEKIKERNSG